MRWTRGRGIKKKEDQAYCPLGIFNVFMYLNYGEGDNAFNRLTEEITRAPRIPFALRVVGGQHLTPTINRIKDITRLRG